MKTFSRDFSKKEIVLIVILSVIILALAYYFAVDQPCRSAINTAQSEQETYQIEYNALLLKISNLRKMQSEIDALNSGELSKMESYNNVANEIQFMNDALADCESYTISLSDVTKDGDQIRRNISIRFQVESYNEACEIITKFENCSYRCLIGDVRISTVDSNNYNILSNAISVTFDITFFETMVGGTADAGLPEA